VPGDADGRRLGAVDPLVLCGVGAISWDIHARSDQVGRSGVASAGGMDEG